MKLLNMFKCKSVKVFFTILNILSYICEKKIHVNLINFVQREYTCVFWQSKLNDQVSKNSQSSGCYIIAGTYRSYTSDVSEFVLNIESPCITHTLARTCTWTCCRLHAHLHIQYGFLALIRGTDWYNLSWMVFKLSLSIHAIIPYVCYTES
jgi:hypothetical protein